MASTIMHMAVTAKAAKKSGIEINMNTDTAADSTAADTTTAADAAATEYGARLMLGAVLPDAYAKGLSKAGSHLDIFVDGGSMKTYDLTAFYGRFGEKMQTDALYLGYYLHLIQDLIFRRFIYVKHCWNPYIPGNVNRLHNDYMLLNTYIIQKYRLKNIIEIPGNFASEPINGLYPFDTDAFTESLKRQLTPYSEGEIFFFTEEMADSYISEAADICVDEIAALSSKKRGLCEYEWAWEKKQTPHV